MAPGAVSAGAELLLSLSGAAPVTRTFSHHINDMHAADARLRTALVEPPIGCQVKGIAGSRLCFGACAGLSSRAPVRRGGAVLPGEEGVHGCASGVAAAEPELEPENAGCPEVSAAPDEEQEQVAGGASPPAEEAAPRLSAAATQGFHHPRGHGEL